MFSTLSHIVSSLSWLPSATFMFACAPQYFLLSLAWRVISLPLPTRTYERGDEMLYTLYQSMVIFFFENMSSVEFVFYGDELPEKGENVIYMANHQCTVDWLIVDSLAIRQGCIGIIRYILKDSLKFIPLYGFYFEQHGCIYVKRRATKDQVNMIRSLDKIRNNKTPVWMTVFPEGTRYDITKPQLLEKRQQYARDQGLPVLCQLLTPKTKAMQACFKSLAGHYNAVYDVTIAYSSKKGTWKREAAPSMTEFLAGRCKTVHIHVKRFGCDEIPNDALEQDQWVHERFRENDKLLSEFYSPGQIQAFGDGRHRPVPSSLTWSSFLFFALSFIPLLGTGPGRMVYVGTTVLGGIGSCLFMMLR
ncbi:1-acyl-sn-glycerol-3-phosphate acyltransferase epsilon-like [Corticium candelabrum]|uniref:1-acyl-sn-glycerol-3-phosphate acyltransferase epsilon-like n=1 Tax=Corticium candelabrum TaxID=121492 RepID=UPI002E263BB5|nr:1-acyl-sn-glycerol-3-phosphate acyltransferase epsilon-like [Corticium candelabrum]